MKPSMHDCHSVQKMINSIVAIIRERVNPILQFLQLVICKLNLSGLWHNNIVVSFNVSQWIIIINSIRMPICGNIVISVKLFSSPNSIPCLYSVCSEILRHVAILLRYFFSRSCSIISCTPVFLLCLPRMPMEGSPLDESWTHLMYLTSLSIK